MPDNYPILHRELGTPAQIFEFWATKTWARCGMYGKMEDRGFDIKFDYLTYFTIDGCAWIKLWA